jgi:glutathione synthase/RimK-type ligase-like ATP-grasp enzyme
MVAHELEGLGASFTVFNQRDFGDYEMSYSIVDGAVDGLLHLGSSELQLNDIRGVFVRLMDDRLLPELDSEPEDSRLRISCRSLHERLTQWFEIAPARVVNRYGPMGSNGSKPYQAQLITAHGFRTPETLITNDPEQVREFAKRHDRVVYKSISGVRSIVTELSNEDLSRLEQIKHCPTQFQQRVNGEDVRVHVVGDNVFATAIASDGTDYRYAEQQGSRSELSAIELPEHIAERTVALAKDLGLGVAGIDLMVDNDGDVYCFEVNPSPAFSYYELNTGQPIARAVARYLSAA